MKIYQQHDSKMCVHKGRIYWNKGKRKLLRIIVGMLEKKELRQVYLGRLIES